MKFLKNGKRNSLLSEALYIGLNLVLVAAIFAAVQIGYTPWLAFGLVILSKWRIFAVRPRYWPANIRANMVDTIVGLSFVVFLAEGSGSLAAQIALSALYAGWLLFIKPRSKRSFMSAQALIGTLFGFGAIVQYSPDWPVSVVVLLAWLVGYSSARHIMSSQNEAHINFLSVLWGFVIAELAWLTYHWTIGYQIVGNLQLAQSTIIVVAISFVAERIHSSLMRHGQIHSSDVILPILLAASVITVLLVQFNDAIAI